MAYDFHPRLGNNDVKGQYTIMPRSSLNAYSSELKFDKFNQYEETANKVTWGGSKYGCASQINAFRYNFGGKTNIPLKM